MYLQHRIKISKENANNLIATINKRDYLWEIQNSNFLREDLESLKESYHNRKNKTESEIEPVMKDLGNFVSPDYGIILRYLYKEYSKYSEAGKTQDLLFSCGPFANGLPIIPCIAFYVINKDSRKIQLFNQCFCEQNIRQKDLMADKIIFELASFFCNRKDLYSKIREVLTNNIEEFSDAATPDFIRDLILLFSAEENSEKVETLDLDFSKMEERKASNKFNPDGKIRIERMTCHTKSTDKSDRYFSRLQTETWLDKNNTLIFNTYEENYDNQKSDIEDYPNAEAFVKARAGDMLNQLILSTNFQAAIYEKVKTKILLEKI